MGEKKKETEKRDKQRVSFKIGDGIGDDDQECWFGGETVCVATLDGNFCILTQLDQVKN